MRRLIALAAAALLVVGCGGPSATDPYAVVDQSLDASYDTVQVNVGLSATSAGTPIAIDPGAVQLVVDRLAGKAAFKLSLPVASLGPDATALRGLGVTGDTLDVDVVWDGAGLYARGAVVSTLLTLLMAQAGQTPGDLSGWLRLGTKAEFEALVGSLGQGAIPTAGPVASHDAASIRKALGDAGIVLSYAGSETRSGKDAHHLTATIDVTKLGANPGLGGLTGTPLQQVGDAFKDATLGADVWIDKSSNRLLEVDVHATSKDGSGDKADLTVLISEPSDSGAISAPATYTEVPLTPIIQSLMQSLLGGSIFAP
jgi:hypothetical protein